MQKICVWWHLCKGMSIYVKKSTYNIFNFFSSWTIRLQELARIGLAISILIFPLIFSIYHMSNQMQSFPKTNTIVPLHAAVEQTQLSYGSHQHNQIAPSVQLAKYVSLRCTEKVNWEAEILITKCSKMHFCYQVSSNYPLFKPLYSMGRSKQITATSYETW